MKRLFDLAFSLAACLVLALPFIFLAVLIRLKLGSLVFFRQKRIGQYGKLFGIVKFRTMIDKRTADGRLLPDAERTTRFGLFLRSTSLDELPELWNVIKGDMSLVGPRPLLPQYLSRYTPRQARRHEIRPGITGWAQIKGRNAVDWAERFELDVWYVDNRNFVMDLKILFLTLFTVLKQEGVSAKGHVTMPEFMGDQTGKTS